MIITCKECSTSFNLDDSLIKESGSKCRCSKCQAVFTVFPEPADGQELEFEESAAPALDPAAGSSDVEAQEDDFSFDGDDDDFFLDQDEPDDLEIDSSDPDLEMDSPDPDSEADEEPEDVDAGDGSLDFDSPDAGQEIEFGEASDEEGSGMELEGGGSELEELDLEMEEEELSIDDSELEMDDSALETEVSELKMESTEPDEGLDMEETELSMEGDEGPESEDNEPQIEGSGLEMEGDLSFSDDALEIEPSDDFEDDELEFDAEDIAFEPETSKTDDDPDGIEFEPIEEDDEEFESFDLPSGQPEGETLEIEDRDLEIEPLPDGSPDGQDPAVEPVQSDDDDFELEFDVEPEEETDDHQGPAVTPENDFSAYDEVLEKDAEPDDTLQIEEIDQDEDRLDETGKEFPEPEAAAAQTLIADEKPVLTPKPAARRKKKKKSKLGSSLLLLLMLICFLIIGAYIASIMTGYHIPYISDMQIPVIEKYLKKPAAKTSAAKPVPNQKSVNGRFVTNSKAGTLFVITGRVENPSDSACRFIQIQGNLITQTQKPAKTKTVYCGNIIPEEVLKTGTMEDIDKALNIKAGGSDLNAKIAPRGSIPFMIVFSELPEKLQNFTVKVSEFEKIQ